MAKNKGGLEHMTKIDTDFVRQKWQYKPEFTTADTSSISNLCYTTTSTDSDAYIAAEINRKVREIYRERESKLMGISFIELEKELKEFGIQLSTIRRSSGEYACEIEGYFEPDVYKRYRARGVCSVPIIPKKPLPKKVIFNGPATTILWKDGTKTTVKCSDEDVWSDDVGIAMCYLKKMLGNKGNYNNIFREAMKVAEVQTKKEELATSTAIEGDSYYSSALDSMKQNINEINEFMKDAADALDKALGGKK